MSLVDFILACGQLKRTPRSGWLAKGVCKAHVESVAEHLLRTTMVAMLIADLMEAGGSRVNTPLVLRTALLHDFPEAVLKDIDKEAWKYLSPDLKLKLKAEREIFSDLLKHTPANLQKKYRKIWMRYERKTSTEARIVEAADKLEMAFQAFEYVQNGYPKKMVASMLKDLEENIRKSNLPVAIGIFEELTSRL